MPELRGAFRTPRPPLTWVALAISAMLMVGGLLSGAPKVFDGHVARLLPALSVFTFMLLFFGVPTALVICNAAAYLMGGRRVLRCFALTATLLGGLVFARWLAHSAPPAHAVFDGDGRVALSVVAIRVHGLLSWAASVGMFCVSAWILLWPSHQSAVSSDHK